MKQAPVSIRVAVKRSRSESITSSKSFRSRELLDLEKVVFSTTSEDENDSVHSTAVVTVIQDGWSIRKPLDQIPVLVGGFSLRLFFPGVIHSFVSSAASFFPSQMHHPPQLIEVILLIVFVNIFSHPLDFSDLFIETGDWPQMSAVLPSHAGPLSFGSTSMMLPQSSIL